MTTLLAVAVTGATLGTGCTTFSDNDAVARVNDIELSSAELRERADARGAPQDEALAADAVRQEIGVWIDEQLVGATDPAVSAETYEQGLLASGSICIALIIVTNPQEAADTVDELNAGADFATIFGERNIDPSLDADQGRVGCFAVDELPLGSGNTLVDSLLELDQDNPYTFATLPGNAGEPDAGAVSRFIPYAELGPDETPVVNSNLPSSATDVDVHVDPRYGTYDATARLVVPLG